MHRTRAIALGASRAGSALLFVAASIAAGAQSPATIRAADAAGWGSAPRLVEELRIGALEGEEEYVFGRIDAVAVGRDGTIWVADGQVPIIRLYDARGRFVRNAGRSGQGPGEYGSIGGLKALPDGRVAVWDNRNRRITIFSATGDYVTAHRVESGLFASDVFQADRSGHFYVRAIVGPHAADGNRQEVWVRVSPSGAVVDTIPIPAEPDRARSFVLATASGYDRPFTRELVSVMSSLGYLITGHNDRYALDLHRRDAPPLRIERPHTPLPVTRDERAEWEAWARMFERRAATPAAPGAPRVMAPPPVRGGYTIPETKPAFKDLRTDSQGRIWVRRYVTAQSRPGPERPPGDDRPRRVWREPPAFDVFEPTGRFLGTVTLPWDAYLYDAIDRQLWATVRGDADEAYVVRLRIEPGGS